MEDVKLKIKNLKNLSLKAFLREYRIEIINELLDVVELEEQEVLKGKKQVIEDIIEFCEERGRY